jgi:Na+/proline symporter
MIAIAVVAYIVAVLAIGIVASRLIKNSSDFINAGRSLPMFFNATALFALWYGSNTIFGASSEFLDAGFLGVIIDPFGGTLCLVLFALFFARPLYRMNMLTLGDLFREKYSKQVEVAAGILMLLMFIGWIAAQLVAIGILFQSIFSIELVSGILCGALVVALYTMAGGMWAISISDFLQSIIIVSGLLWVAWVLADLGGGVPAILNSAPKGHFSLLPPPGAVSVINYLAAWSVLGLGSLASQDVFQRVNAARNERTAVTSTLLGAGFYIIFAMLPLFIALASRAIEPGAELSDTQRVIPYVIAKYTTEPVQIIFFGALISALLSTCSGAILAPASILSNNILKPLFFPSISDKRMVMLLRISVIIMTAVSLGLSIQRQNIYELVGESSIIGLVSLLVPMTAAIYMKNPGNRAAFLSMFAGLAVWFITEYVWPTEVASLVYGTAASVLGMVAGHSWRRSGSRSPL